MRQKVAGAFQGHIKVDITSHHPRRWGWSIYRDTGSGPVLSSNTPFHCAESAWDAARLALKALEQGAVKGKAA